MNPWIKDEFSMNVPYVKKVLKEENLKWHIEIIHKEENHMWLNHEPMNKRWIFNECPICEKSFKRRELEMAHWNHS